VVEHNLDMLRAADFLIDLGPEAGEGGGEVVAQGRPEDLIRTPGASHTARWLVEPERDAAAGQGL